MTMAVILLRVIHIVCAVFWGGTIFFVAMFLEPTVRTAGPAGGVIMQGLEKRGFATIMPIIAWLAILSGLSLLWIDSAGFNGVYMGSPKGITYSLGALGALSAIGVGLAIMRPTVVRMGHVMGEASKAPEGPARDALLAPVGELRKKLTMGARLTSAFLGVSVLAMALARYMN